eukprot:m.143037 g.143037  ORF g.143037 m.143037 type:complete len:525 (-) comp14086_c0_seq4:296-1870(-)
MAGHRSLEVLPKAHLHLHLEGAMRRGTLVDLCATYGIEPPPDTRGLSFDDFSGFLATYTAACECIRTESDLQRLVLEVAEDAALDGATWIEPAASIPMYAHRFGGVETTIKILLSAAAKAEAATGVGIGLILAAERHLSPEVAETFAADVQASVLEHLQSHREGPRVVGFGLHSDERGNPPELFAKTFEIALNGTKLLAVPHAGELELQPGEGAASVRYCVEQLGAKRIAHGVLAATDPGLLVDLAQKRICCDVCPSSNLRLRVCRRLEDHPILQLLAANVPVTINADDPLLFGCTLAGEYSLCRAQIGLSDSQLAECARASFRHSCAPEAVKSAALAAINDWAQSEGSIERPGAAKAVVIMGVCGTGKTTTAELLAEKLGAVFLEGDDFHSVENKAKMGRGEPLTDEDRWPWLDALAAAICRLHQDRKPVVVACSALKKAYRDRLRTGSQLTLIHLVGDAATIAERMDARKGHYMGSGMIKSQFDALELPDMDEKAVSINIHSLSREAILERILRNVQLTPTS